jgi:DNA mismatch endonuclease (patch repair protein)
MAGRPDVVLRRYQTVVFVHGCFWHRHRNCRYAYTPKSNLSFWQEKLSANMERDLRVQRVLKRAGWKVVVIWECQTTDTVWLARRFSKSISRRAPKGPALSCAP